MKRLKLLTPKILFLEREALSSKKKILIGCLSLIYGFGPLVFAQDTESFEYDALGRLVRTENVAAGMQIDYAYDAAGNRTQVAVTAGGVTPGAVASFSVDDVVATEGEAMSFTVTKSGTTSQSHSISYSTANGSAESSDYTGVSGTLTFTSGQSAKTVSLSTTADSIHETNETLYVNLSNSTGGATISDGQGVGTVNNDDAAPSFSVNDISGIESQGLFVFTVTKSGATSETHAVSFATSPGTAGTGDYSSGSGSLSFTSGQTSKTLSVPIAADSFQEVTEVFYLNLSSPTNSATVSDSQGIGTILDDDSCEQNCW